MPDVGTRYEIPTQAVKAVVHNNESPQKALERHHLLKNET